LSCGILETPRFGRKSNFAFTPGAVVTFECNEGFFLNGDRRRTCGNDGNWDIPQYGYTECLRESSNPLLSPSAITFARLSLENEHLFNNKLELHESFGRNSFANKPIPTLNR